jgi:Site-specific recombinase XerD
MQTMTTTQAKDLFLKALTGNNYSERTIRAYSDDLTQFLSWVQCCRTDWDVPTRFTRIDIVEFMNHQAAHLRDLIPIKRK